MVVIAGALFLFVALYLTVAIAGGIVTAAVNKVSINLILVTIAWAFCWAGFWAANVLLFR